MVQEDYEQNANSLPSTGKKAAMVQALCSGLRRHPGLMSVHLFRLYLALAPTTTRAMPAISDTVLKIGDRGRVS